VFHRKLFEDPTGSFHKLIISAIISIEDKFVSYDVIGAEKAQLLGLIGSCAFKTAVSGQGLIVN
jgi:hypothetical protein